MPDFRQRSRQEELLDQPKIPKADLFQNLKELDTINRLLGGHNATLVGLQNLMNDGQKTYTIVDFACGGGDTLRAISQWANEKGLSVRLMGFDLLEGAIEFAKQESTAFEIEWKVGDFNTIELPHCDIAICSLVCHHFYDEQLNNFILKMKESAKIGAVINDLHRNSIAYFGIAFLTHVFSKSHLVKNDARLSVLKGFTKGEWQKILQNVNFRNYTIKWIWAFRHLVIIRN